MQMRGVCLIHMHAAPRCTSQVLYAVEKGQIKGKDIAHGLWRYTCTCTRIHILTGAQRASRLNELLVLVITPLRVL